MIFNCLRLGDTDEDRAHLQKRAHRVATAGEPCWFSYFTLDDMAARLRTLGFTDIEDHSATDLTVSYLDASVRLEGEPPQARRASRILRASR